MNYNEHINTLARIWDITKQIDKICKLDISNKHLSVNLKDCMLHTCLNKIEKVCEDINKPEQADKTAEEMYYTVCTALYCIANHLVDAHMTFGISAKERRTVINKVHSLGLDFADAHTIHAIEMAYNRFFEESGENKEIMVIPDFYIDERLDSYTDDSFLVFARNRAKQLIKEFPDRRIMLPEHTAMLI